MEAACQRATTSRDPISIRSLDPSPAHKITVYGWSISDEHFDTNRTFALRVDRHSRISVRTNCYSVPARFIGSRVRTVLHANE
jgi:hypothetical protein